MKEYRIENPVEVRAVAPPPHFEDRSVVLTAQPVVPLKQIRTKQRRQRLWFLSGAFAIAMMLGAASALVAVRVKRIAPTNEATQIAAPEAAATAIPTEEPAIVDSGEQIADSTVKEGPVEEERVEEEPVEQPARPVAPKRQEPLAQRPRIVNHDRDDRAVQPSEDEELQQIREAVLYERWQERRARRIARRERRNRVDDRDLSRVDEIFEGRRRRTDRPY